MGKPYLGGKLSKDERKSMEKISKRPVKRDEKTKPEKRDNLLIRGQ